MRHKADVDRVRHYFRRIAPDRVADTYADHIIHLRAVLKQAATMLDDPNRGAAEARVLLRDTLEREGWWRR